MHKQMYQVITIASLEQADQYAEHVELGQQLDYLDFLTIGCH